MAAGRTVGFGVLGAMLGGAAGGVAGFLGGLAWTTVAHTSSFEGKSGFVVVFWLLAGVVAGLVAGAVIGVKKGR
jgi:hypothetical protein